MSDALVRMSRGVAWAAAARWFDVLASTLTFFVLASLLGPEAWGLYGMALVITVLPETILGGALSDILIQRKTLEAGHVGAARSIQLCLAVIFLLGCVILSPFFTQWFGHDEVALLAPALALTFVPLGFAAPSIALLQRKLRFREIALVDAAGALAAALTGVGVALAGGGAWSLVAMEGARRTVRSIMFLLLEGSPPSLLFNWANIRDLTHFNLMTLSTQLLMQIDLAIPRLIIGTMIGPSALGYFNFAWRLYQQGSALVIAPFNAVVLPTIARLRDDRERLHAAIRQTMEASTIAAYPVFLGAAAIAPVAVPLVLGEHWRPAVGVIQLMLLLGLRSATNAFSGSILRGCGKPGWQTANVAVGVLATCCLVPWAAPYGIEAVACAMLFKAVLIWVSGAILVERASGYGAMNQVMIGWRNLFAALVMATSVAFATQALAGMIDGWPLLVIAIASGASVYATLVYFLNPKIARDAMLALVRRIARIRGLRSGQAP